MKVLFLSIYDPFKPSGPGNHLRCLSEALSGIGVEVHVLMPGAETKSVKIKKLIIHYVKAPSFGRGFLFSFTSVGWTNQIVKKYGIDIVHGHSPSSIGYALLSRKKVPFVVTLHSTSFGELSSLSSMPLKSFNFNVIRNSLVVQSLTAFLTYFEYKFAHKIIAVSGSIAEEAKSFCNIPEKKIAIIHNGVNPVSIDTDKQTTDHSILFVGRLIWRKGVKYTIDALPEILADYPATKLFIVGNGEQKPSLEKLVKAYKIEGSVNFLGYISAERLFALYSTADVYVQPSLYEPCPLAILEAMSLGKPIIAAHIGGIRELITTGAEGLLVKPANSSELAIAVKRIFSDSQLKENLGQEAREKVEQQFTWALIAKKTLKLYETLQKGT